jgi:hypothetical protein
VIEASVPSNIVSTQRRVDMFGPLMHDALTSLSVVLEHDAKKSETVLG